MHLTHKLLIVSVAYIREFALKRVKSIAKSAIQVVQESYNSGGKPMPKGPQGQIRPADAIGNAVHIAKIATGEAQETELKQPAKRNSGLAGAKARQENTTQEDRQKISKIAAEARWKQ